MFALLILKGKEMLVVLDVLEVLLVDFENVKIVPKLACVLHISSTL